MFPGLKQFGGWYLPEGETHLTGWMSKMQQRADNGRLGYQIHKLNMAMQLVKSFRRAIDVGAHCGLLSYQLAGRFKAVEAFEPLPLHRDAFKLNCPQANINLHAMALGQSNGFVSMNTNPVSSGDTTVGGDGDIPLRRLDDVLSDSGDVDFLKLDCEGFELFALRGGEELLKRCRPAIMVEQKPNKAQQFGLPETGAVDYLQSLGAKLKRVHGGDYFLSWN